MAMFPCARQKMESREWYLYQLDGHYLQRELLDSKRLRELADRLDELPDLRGSPIETVINLDDMPSLQGFLRQDTQSKP